MDERSPQGTAKPKAVCVVVRQAPIGTGHAAEGLRMAVGLTLAGHRVTVVLADAGVLAGLLTRPGRVGAAPLAKPIEMLLALGHAVWVEHESLARFGLPAAPLLPGVAVLPGDVLWAEIAASDVVLSA